MSQSLTKRTLFSAMTFALAACGGGDKIDATNADTLKSSLQSIAESMTETERQAFGQDVLLVFERDKSDSDNLGIGRLYSNEYSILFSSEANAAPFVSAVFGDIVLTAGSSLNDQTPASLAKSAKTIRSEAFASYASELEERNAELSAKLDGIPASIEAHQAKFDETDARRAELANQSQTAVSNISIAKFTLNRRLQAIVEGTADVTNHTDVPVTHVQYTLETGLPSIRGYHFSSTQSLQLETPLNPGSTLSGFPIDFTTIGLTAIKQEPNAKRVQLSGFVGDLETTEPNANLVSYVTLNATRRNLDLTGQEQSFIRGFERLLQKCEESKTKFADAVSANEAFIATVRAAASDPKPVEGRFQRVTVFGDAC